MSSQVSQKVLCKDVCFVISKFIVNNEYKLINWINQDKIIWSYLSGNPNAIKLLEQNQDKINWEMLSGNPNAIKLLEQNQDKINWYMLSSNPNAIKLLEQNQDKINWMLFSKNPNIFEIEVNNKRIKNFTNLLNKYL